MLTRKALKDLFISISSELSSLGLPPDRIVLFGSYAKENVDVNSDVDIAIWQKQFTGTGLIDMELIRPILRKHRGLLDIKFYPSGATAENYDPFISEIEQTGLEWIQPENRFEIIREKVMIL